MKKVEKGKTLMTTKIHSEIFVRVTSIYVKRPSKEFAPTTKERFFPQNFSELIRNTQGWFKHI